MTDPAQNKDSINLERERKSRDGNYNPLSGTHPT